MSLSALLSPLYISLFQVEGLQSQKSFTVAVHSVNLRGESERVRLVATTGAPPALVARTQDINQVTHH